MPRVHRNRLFIAVLTLAFLPLSSCSDSDANATADAAYVENRLIDWRAYADKHSAVDSEIKLRTHIESCGSLYYALDLKTRYGYKLTLANKYLWEAQYDHALRICASPMHQIERQSPNRLGLMIYLCVLTHNKIALDNLNTYAGDSWKPLIAVALDAINDHTDKALPKLQQAATAFHDALNPKIATQAFFEMMILSESLWHDSSSLTAYDTLLQCVGDPNFKTTITDHEIAVWIESRIAEWAIELDQIDDGWIYLEDLTVYCRGLHLNNPSYENRLKSLLTELDRREAIRNKPI